MCPITQSLGLRVRIRCIYFLLLFKYYFGLRLRQEDNLGLVKLVVDSQTKRNVQRLTQTYLTLSLPDIAAAVGLPSAAAAELAILRCVPPKIHQVTKPFSIVSSFAGT